jgi:hypothetical protein
MSARQTRELRDGRIRSCLRPPPPPPPVGHRSTVSSRQHAVNVLLVSGDCILTGLKVKAASHLLWLVFFDRTGGASPY